jgi:NlpC/P60 family putative phage cell wall peptidase
LSYPGQAYFWEHNPRIYRAETDFQRREIVAEARSWIGTPYHLGGQVKGAGCDCATLLYCVWRACGLVPDEEIGVFANDWFCHDKEEKYLLRIMRRARLVAEAVSYPTLQAKPGCIVLTRAANSRVFNHGAIVADWPRVIHSVDPAVEECDASTHRLWAYKTVAVFDPFEKPKT